MTVFEINKQDIVYNFNELSHLTHALVIPTLKANAYGLGADEVSKLLRDTCGVTLFAVSRLEEADTVCDGAKVLLLSCYHDPSSIKQIVDKNIICAVDSIGQARRISDYAKECGKVASVHLKIDTGFGRFGFKHSDVSQMKAVFELENIKITGIFSHFSNAFCDDMKNTDLQLERFLSVCETLTAAGLNVGIRHIANSSAALKDHKYCLDAVRIGSALTGRVPFKTSVSLKRVGRFYSDIVDIRTLKRGQNLGYGNICKLKRDTRVAVLCCGSADGVLIKKDYDTFRFIDILRYGYHVFKMLFANNMPTAKVNGQAVRFVGRPALTHTFIDVTGVDCCCGDRAELNISPLYIADKVKREYID